MIHVDLNQQAASSQPPAGLSGGSYVDPVSAPAHYTQYPGIEVIQLTEHLNFCRGNAVKYIARAGSKDTAKEVEDLRKAIWYIEREISRITRTVIS